MGLDIFPRVITCTDKTKSFCKQLSYHMIFFFSCWENHFNFRYVSFSFLFLSKYVISINENYFFFYVIVMSHDPIAGCKYLELSSLKRILKSINVILHRLVYTWLWFLFFIKFNHMTSFKMIFSLRYSSV